MRQKIKKALLIGGGVFIFSEICGTLGEVQSLVVMHKTYPQEVDETLDSLMDVNVKGHCYAKFKCKIVAKLSRFYIDNNIC